MNIFGLFFKVTSDSTRINLGWTHLAICKANHSPHLLSTQFLNEHSMPFNKCSLSFFGGVIFLRGCSEPAFKKIAPGRIWWKHRILEIELGSVLVWSCPRQIFYCAISSVPHNLCNSTGILFIHLNDTFSLYIQMNGRHTFLFNLGWEMKLGT